MVFNPQEEKGEVISAIFFLPQRIYCFIRWRYLVNKTTFVWCEKEVLLSWLHFVLRVEGFCRPTVTFSRYDINRLQSFHRLCVCFSNQYLSRGIEFSGASLNGALTQHKNEDIKTSKLEN